MDRLFNAVSAILDFADDRSAARGVAAGSMLATIASWWFAVSRSTLAAVADAAANAPLNSADRLLAAVAVFAPFVFVNAVWQAVCPPDATSATSEDYGPLTQQHLREESDRRRRRLLAAAFAGVLNGLVMYIVTH